MREGREKMERGGKWRRKIERRRQKQ